MTQNGLYSKASFKSLMFKISAAYVILGAFWIFYFDILLEGLKKGLETQLAIQTIEGVLLIAIPIALFYLLLRKTLHAISLREESLLESEERWRTIVEASPNAIVLFGLSGELLMTNQQGAELVGYANVPELISQVKNAFAFLAPEDHQRARENIQKLIVSGVHRNIEYRGIRRDGSRFPVEVSTSLQRDPQGEPKAIVGILKDITDRKRVEEELKKSEAMFRSVLAAAPAGVAVLTNRVLTQVNAAFCRITGYTEEELIRQSTRMLYPNEEEYSEVGRLLYAQMEQAGLGMLEVRLQRKDGTNIDTLICVSPFNSQDPSAGVSAVLLDITDRKRTERELQRLKNYLTSMIDSMPATLVGMNHDGTITLWNKQAEAMMGVPAAAALGRPIKDFLPQFQPWIETLRSRLEKAGTASIEKALLVRDGERRFFDLMLYPLANDPHAGEVLRIEDVTERAKIQDLIIQTEKMLSVGGLAGGMAHELNNPLGIISQAAQNIERRLSPELAANREAAQEFRLSLKDLQDYLRQRGILQFLQDIRESSSRATNIIANMLEFSRKSQNVKEPVDLKNLIESSLELAAGDYDLRKGYDFRGIELRREYADDLPKVAVVATEIKQVLLNVLKNAGQAMIENPPERKPRITLRLRRDAKYAIIEIADNGPGMEERVLHRVFEPFFTTKEPGFGTGIGLSVSYTIVTINHKGLISVESTPGNGACFTICLPLN